MPPWIISINFRSLAVLRLRSSSSSVSTGHFQPFMPMRNGEAKKRHSGAFSARLSGCGCPIGSGSSFTLGLTLSLWGAGLAGICGCLPLVGHSLPATVGALGVIIGARISDTLVSHWGLYALGYRPNLRSQVYATLRARSGFHCADILERPLACSGCGVDRHCGGRGCFRAGVAGDAGVQGDWPSSARAPWISMAAAAGVDERVTSRLRAPIGRWPTPDATLPDLVPRPHTARQSSPGCRDRSHPHWSTGCSLTRSACPIHTGLVRAMDAIQRVLAAGVKV